MSILKIMPIKYGLWAFGFMVIYFIFLSLIPGRDLTKTAVSPSVTIISEQALVAGMTSADVEKLFGKPEQVVWKYGNSTIEFKFDKVSEWSDPDARFKIRQKTLY
ncbi:MAG: hypothetical protein ACQETH_13755 [Candidatus Rifleibacteriota bacterium]